MVKVREYLDRFFAKYEMTEELYDLKDEITLNAQDRYRDYLEQGYSEAEASEKVLDSLGNLEELMNEVNATPLREDYRGILHDVITTLFGERRKGNEHYSEVFAGVNELILNVTSADVSVSISPDDCIHVEANGDDAMLEVVQEEERVTLTENRHGLLSFGGIETVEISLPEGMKALEIHVVNGDIEISDVEVPLITIGTVNGDVDLSDILFDSLQIHTVNGDTEIESEGTFDLIQCQSVSGDVSISLPGVEGVDFAYETLSGDVECSLDYDSRHAIRVTTVSGDIDITD